MKNKYIVSLLIPILSVLNCGSGFERFVPPSNSISGRGAKVPPHIIATTPTDGTSVSPITGATGTQIKVVFDMTMQTTGTPLINTYFRDLDPSTGNPIWLTAANSGATFSWSSTNVGDDTLTIQLGWVRWPENNVIGFDFNNSSLVNLDSIPLDNSKTFSFTVQWDTGKYKTVPTGQFTCYYVGNGVSANPDGWFETAGCTAQGGSDPVGSYNYPAGQNAMVDPRSATTGPTLYGSNAGTIQKGSRFHPNFHPENINLFNATNCTGKSTDQCYPYTADSVTTLVWKTCTEGQYYADQSSVGGGDKCTPGAGTDYTYGNAINACAGLNTANNGQGYGGRKDWRLPTVQELESLVDYGAKTQTGTPNLFDAPAIHGYNIDATDWPVSIGAFPNTPTSKAYWTATGASGTFAGSLQYLNAFVVEFKKGGVSPIGSSGSLLESSRQTTNRKKVRCVAGPTTTAPTQSLSASTMQSSRRSLTTNAATFMGFDAGSRFNVASASAYFDALTTKYFVQVNYDQAPNTTQANTIANYCIGLATDANFGACSVSLTFSAASTTGNTTTLDLNGAVPIPGRAYKIFVQNVTSNTGSIAMTVDRAYFSALPAPVSPYAAGTTFNVLRASSPSSNTIQLVFDYAPDLPGANNAANYCITTLGAAICPPSSLTVSSAQVSGYTVLLTTTTPLVTGTVYKIFVTGITSVVPNFPTPTALTTAQVHLPLAFNVASATSPNSSTVQVTFDKLPDPTQATTVANYCITTGAATTCPGPSVPLIASASLSGYTVTLTTQSALTTGGVAYSVFASNINYAGAQVVTDNVNNLLWKKCRLGLLDNSTCSDDGVATNDTMEWNDGLNNCNQLNAEGYAGYAFGWRAPTINELKSIDNRPLFKSFGYSLDITTFPTPSVTASNGTVIPGVTLETYGSSTSVVFNGLQNQPGAPNNDQFWTYSYLAGMPSFATKDKTSTPAGFKPPKSNFRCVRSPP